MHAPLRHWLSRLGDTFWLIPAALVVSGMALAFSLLAVDRSNVIPLSVLKGNWLYNGGATGARTLLGAVASSTIGVASTVFSITIAALSLAAGQMGPRLLRNFVRDRGNQITLGIFLATFCYALLVLRSVRTEAEGAFIPHLSLTVALVLAFLSVGTLVYFVGHMAQRINVDVVIDLVSEDVRAAIGRLTSDRPSERRRTAVNWIDAEVVRDSRRGYVHQIDEGSLADWASDSGVTIKLLVKPGDYVFPGAPIGLINPSNDGAAAAIRQRTALAAQRSSSDDAEYAIRQLVEVAVRALSPGINDPHTAISVIDRLGAALCDLTPVHLHSGQLLRADRLCLEFPTVDYEGLTDTMFHMIRQNARGNAAVITRVLEVLASVASVERNPSRLRSLQRHADLFMQSAERDITSPADLGELRLRYTRFALMLRHGPAPSILLRNEQANGTGEF
jgi:uncharacterized membrane protein